MDMKGTLRIGIVAAAALAAAAPALAQSGGTTLRVMINSDMRSTDPGVNRDLNSDAVVVHMLEGLVAYREDTSIGPLLAERVEQSADGLTYTFTLRDGVRFHNGQPLTSADVVSSWRRYLDPATQWRCLSVFGENGTSRIADVSAPDARTVVFRLAAPSAMFLGQMARTDCGGAGIYHRDSLNADGTWKEPVGTGPFRMGEWQRGQWLEIVRFDGYASRGGDRDGLTGGKQVHVDRVRYTIIPDGAAAKAALYSGAIHVRPDFSARDIAEARQRQDVRVATSPTMELNTLLLQTADPVMGDVRIRRALALAVDREALVETLTEGLVPPVNSPIPLASAFSGPAQKAAWRHDPDEARRLLREAGYDGRPVKLVTTQRFMSLYNGAVFVQEMAREVGLNIELEVLEWATMLDRYSAGTHQAMFFSFSARLDPSLSFEMFTGPRETQPRKVWSDPKAIALVDESMTTPSPERRQAIFDELQGMFNEQVPMVPLWNSADIVAHRANVSGYSTWAAAIPRYWGVRAD
jgi:peptide/nickel transport system substrate-binding protein